MPRPIFLAVLVLTVLRACLAVVHEISPAEAHLVLCAERPAAAYFDFGPLAPWVVKIGTWGGGRNAWAVRWLAPVLALVVSGVAYRLSASFYDDRTARWTVLLLNLTPIFNAFGILFVPDSLGFTAWVLAMWFVWRALHRAAAWNRYWPLAGAAMGAGALTAPVNLVEPICLLALLVLSRRWRGRLRRPGPWITVATAAAMTAPLWFWHAEYEWLALRAHWIEWTRNPQPAALLGWAGVALVGLSPLVAAALGWAIVSAARGLSGRRHRAGASDLPNDVTVFLFAFGVPPLVLAGWGAFFGHGGFAAGAPGFFAFGLLLVGRWMRSQFSIATTRLAQHATLLVAGGYSVVLAQTDLVRHWGVSWPYEFDPTAELRGWRVAASNISTLANSLRTGSPPSLIIADSPRLAAAFGFHLPKTTPGSPPAVQTVPAVLPRDDFAFWPRFDSAGHSREFAGANALYLTEGEGGDGPPSILAASFARVDRLGSFEVIRGGHRLRRLTFFACYDYRGPPF